MTLDSKEQREYLLLRTYEENIITRGILIRIPLVALEQIENDTWWNKKFSDEEKVGLKSMIQIDIISKIMMYIEDLAILSESFIQKKDFYQFLIDKSIDIGEMTKNFVRDIASPSNEKVSQIMNYIQQPKKICSDEKCIELLERNLKYHIDKTKNNLRQIANFSSNTNHRLYKRFKHGGMPILSNTLQNPPKSGPLSKFEVFNVVLEGIDPFKDVIFLPYSKDIIVRYENIIGTLQTVLQEMVKNKKICIERNIEGMLPPEYSLDLFTPEERNLMKTIFDDFYNTHPKFDIPKQIHYNLDRENSQEVLEKIRWYLENDT